MYGSVNMAMLQVCEYVAQHVYFLRNDVGTPVDMHTPAWACHTHILQHLYNIASIPKMISII